MGSGVDPPPWPPDRLSQPRAMRLHRRIVGYGFVGAFPRFVARGQVLVRVRRLVCACCGGRCCWQRWVAAVHGGPVAWLVLGGRLVCLGWDEPFGRLGPVG